MGVKKDISDETHRILEEELDDYDPVRVEESVEEWLDRVPPGDESVKHDAGSDS